MVPNNTIETKLAELRKQLQQHIDNANFTQGAIAICEELLKPVSVEPTPPDGHNLS